MDAYGYPYAQYSGVAGLAPPTDYPDHGDGYGEYYGMQNMKDRDPRSSRAKTRKLCDKRSRSGSRSSASRSKSRSSSRSKSRSRSRSKSRSKSRSTHSRSVSRCRDMNLREPSFLDAFRVLYLTPSKNKSTSKYLVTKKRQDRIEEALKSDGLGSKRWLFYPRMSTQSEPATGPVPGQRDNSDQRVKIDGQFFKKYKRSRSVARDSPIAKLKRWELVLYKKLGFIRAE